MYYCCVPQRRWLHKRGDVKKGTRHSGHEQAVFFCTAGSADALSNTRLITVASGRQLLTSIRPGAPTAGGPFGAAFIQVGEKRRLEGLLANKSRCDLASSK